MTVAEKLRLALASIEVPGVPRAITASFGVAAMPDDGSEPSSLLRTADRALYLAKAGGRNRVETLATGARRHRPRRQTGIGRLTAPACQLAFASFRAHSSAGERSLHTREVPGSIPGAPIITNVHFKGFLRLRHELIPRRSRVRAGLQPVRATA